MQGGRRKGGETAPEQGFYAAFLLLPTLALSFVDSGSGAGTKSGSLAILLRSDSSIVYQIPIRQEPCIPRGLIMVPCTAHLLAHNQASAAFRKGCSSCPIQDCDHSEWD